MAYTYPTELYKGWNPDSAQADYNATGGVGKAGYTGDAGNSSGGDFNSIIQNAINSVTSMISGPVKDYEEVNPFFFDEALAKEASTAEYAPYYQELLTDYISNVERTKSRSQEDLGRTLKQLEAGKEYYLGKNRMALDKALRNTNEGYAGRGLFFSGMRPKEIQEIEKENQMDVENYLTGYNYNKSGAELQNVRTGENVDTALSQYTRDTEREKDTAIAGGVLTRKGEVREEYEAGKTKYYQNAGYGGLYGGIYG
jgi:hypothetical protein